MSNKNKLILLIIGFIILIIICNLLLNFEKINYKIKYNKEEFDINEEYKNNNYYIEIKHSDKTYPFRIYSNIHNTKIISKIYYYKDKSYECVLPIFDNKIKVDMQCFKDNILYNYNDIKDNKELSEYVKSIDEYDINEFLDNTENIKNIDRVKYYRDNNISNIVAITTYKGLIVSGMEIELFKNDVYNSKISTFVYNYYLVADYNNTHEFNYFYMVDLTNANIEKIKLKEPISLDSYIQGIVDNIVYLYDKDDEKQYKIDVKNKKIDLIRTGDKVEYYKSGKWTTINRLQAKKEIYFDYTTLDNNFSSYDKVVESTNYYYLFKKNNNEYELYRVDKNNTNVYKYIINIKTTNIIPNKDYLYYVDNNVLKFYSDTKGLISLLEDSEFSFNSAIKYYIY